MNNFSALCLDDNGWIISARHCYSANFDERPLGVKAELLVIHNISLPPFEYGSDDVERLFTNRLDVSKNEFFINLVALRVSAHFFIRRDGELLQFVSVLKRAWHAGASSWLNRINCNDFSVGIELEGCDFEPYSEAQYIQLINLAKVLFEALALKHLAGHADIAKGRKTDPGLFFDWHRLRAALGI